MGWNTSRRPALEAFLGDLDTTPLPTPQRRLPSRGQTYLRPGFAWISSPYVTTTPVHSGGGRFLSRPPFTHLPCTGAGISDLLAIAYAP